MSWSPHDHDAWSPYTPKPALPREHIQEISVEHNRHWMGQAYHFKVVKMVYELDGSVTKVVMESTARDFPEWYTRALREWRRG